MIKIETRYEGTPAEIREYERLRALTEPLPVHGESAGRGDLAPELARFVDRVSHRSLVHDWLSWALASEVDVSGFAGPGPTTQARAARSVRRIGRGSGRARARLSPALYRGLFDDESPPCGATAE